MPSKIRAASSSHLVSLLELKPTEISPNWEDSLKTIIPNSVYALDGDTLILRQQGESFKVRLKFIDCPEKKKNTDKSSDPLDLSQWELGERALSYTVSWVKNKEVSARISGEDQYGRFLGELFPLGSRASSLSLQSRLVRVGLAVAYFPLELRLETKEDLWLAAAIARAQHLSQKEKNGIWSPSYEGELPANYRIRVKNDNKAS